MANIDTKGSGTGLWLRLPLLAWLCIGIAGKPDTRPRGSAVAGVPCLLLSSMPLHPTESDLG
jgi:hypothetical protein